MADVKKMATREGYGRGLVALGAAHEDVVVLDADLAGSTKTGMFAKAYPDRHFNCGIAEADMMCVAAGFAANGFVPFASSFAMFAAGRAFEQIRNSIGYPHLNVKIGATHGGLSVGEDGASHQCCEDFALMRSIPGMVVMCPSDDVEARAAVRAAYAYRGPVYLRFGRLAVPVFHDADTFTFEIGKGTVVEDGTDVTLIAVGDMVSRAAEATKKLSEEGISAAVIDMASVKPIDESLVIAYAKKTGCIVTAEDHNVMGGLGGAVSEVLAKHQPVPQEMVGLQDQFGRSGTPADLAEYYGLTAEKIVEAAKKCMQRK